MTCNHSIHLCQCKDGHPNDREEICIKCGEKFAELKWNGKYLEMNKQEKMLKQPLKKVIMGSKKVMGKK
jgi:hypothetical protein